VLVTLIDEGVASKVRLNAVGCQVASGAVCAKLSVPFVSWCRAASGVSGAVHGNPAGQGTMG
jgi:hypothetical protein